MTFSSSYNETNAHKENLPKSLKYELLKYKSLKYELFFVSTMFYYNLISVWH